MHVLDCRLLLEPLVVLLQLRSHHLSALFVCKREGGEDLTRGEETKEGEASGVDGSEREGSGGQGSDWEDQWV